MSLRACVILLRLALQACGLCRRAPWVFEGMMWSWFLWVWDCLSSPSWARVCRGWVLSRPSLRWWRLEPAKGGSWEAKRRCERRRLWFRFAWSLAHRRRKRGSAGKVNGCRAWWDYHRSSWTLSSSLDHRRPRRQPLKRTIGTLSRRAFRWASHTSQRAFAELVTCSSRSSDSIVPSLVGRPLCSSRTVRAMYTRASRKSSRSPAPRWTLQQLPPSEHVDFSFILTFSLSLLPL